MKLSEENKEWMLKNVHCGKRFRGYDAALDYEVIEEKLLADQQRTDELEKKIVDWRYRALNAEKVIGELEDELLNAESKAYNETEDKLVKLEDKIDELERRNGDLQFALDEILYAYRTAVHSFTPSQYQNDTDNLRCVIARHLNKESK